MKTLFTANDVMSLYGTVQTAAAALGVDPNAVRHWNKNDAVPAKKQLQLAHILDNDKTLKMELAKARRARARAARAK